MLSTDLDVFDNLFEPMAVTPLQHYGVRRLTPEQRLMLAVLQDALRMIGLYRYEHRHSEARRLYEEAVDWFKTDGVWDMGYSFGYVCEALGLNTDAVRRAVWVNHGRCTR